MFCEKCGCRIPASALHCPECGAVRPETEFCTGFWSDLNQYTGQNRMETNETDAGKKTGTDLQSVNTSHIHNEEDRQPETAGPQKEELADDSEAAGPQKGKSADKPGNPEKRGHLIQLIEAVIILVLLVSTVILGTALKSKATRIEFLEKKLEKAEAGRQGADKKSGTAALSGKDEETGIDNSESDSTSPMTVLTEGKSQEDDDNQNPRPAFGIGLKESESSDSSSSSATGPEALKSNPWFPEEQPQPVNGD